jgi:hypothetical protein
VTEQAGGFHTGIVEFMQDGTHQSHYIRLPFKREPDFDVTSVNFSFAKLLVRAEHRDEFLCIYPVLPYRTK